MPVDDLDKEQSSQAFEVGLGRFGRARNVVCHGLAGAMRAMNLDLPARYSIGARPFAAGPIDLDVTRRRLIFAGGHLIISLQRQRAAIVASSEPPAQAQYSPVSGTDPGPIPTGDPPYFFGAGPQRRLFLHQDAGSGSGAASMARSRSLDLREPVVARAWQAIAAGGLRMTMIDPFGPLMRYEWNAYIAALRGCSDRNDG